MRRCFLLALLLVCFAETSFGQVIVTATPAADTFVTSASPNSNYGAAGGIGVAAPGLAKGEFRSFIRFDTSSIKSSLDTTFGAGNWTVQSVTLRLSATAPNNPIFNGNGAGPGGTNVNTAGNFTVSWISDDSWTEGTGTPAAPSATGVTFNAPPSAAGAQVLGTFNFNGATSGTQTCDLALSAGLLADLSAGGLLSSQLVTANGETSIAYLFNSRSTANAPLLSVTAVPEPATLSLCCALLPALLRRKRH
jgi:hypothetical protein